MGPGSDGRRRVPRQATQSVSDLLDVAARIFDEKGFHPATMADVAEAAGITKGGLYYYLDGKVDTLLQIHRRYLQAGLRGMRAIADDSELSPLEKLRALVIAVCGQHDEYYYDLRLTLMEFKSLTGDLRDEVIALRDEYEDVVRGIFDEGIDTGALAPGDPDLYVKYVFGACNWMCVWYRQGRGQSAAAIGARFADFVLNGLVAR